MPNQLCQSVVLIGVPFFDAVFSLLGCEVVWNMNEGDFVQPVCEVATVTGKVRQADCIVMEELNRLSYTNNWKHLSVCRCHATF